MRTTQQGVTLIELMITVAIVAILAAIAYPSYQNQIRKSHRAEGKAALLEIQVAQEKFFLAANAYATTLGALNRSATTEHGYYNIALSNLTATTYTATATPAGSQTSDSCGAYSITHTGARSPTTSGCW